MKYGLYVPNFGKSSDPRTFANLAVQAEKAGWDGFFLWDHLVEGEQRVPVTDSFIALSAIAQQTTRIRIGTTVTPLPRLKPWIVARQTVALDQLSNGRMILGVGLGLEETCAYKRLNESADNKVLLKSWTNPWRSLPAFGVENPSVTKVNTTGSERPLSYQNLSRNLAYPSGLADLGRIKDRSNVRHDGTERFLSSKATRYSQLRTICTSFYHM